MKYTFKKERTKPTNYKLMFELWDYGVSGGIADWIIYKKQSHKAMDKIAEESYLSYLKKKSNFLSRFWHAVV